LGLERLGFEVALIEPVATLEEAPLASTESARYFDAQVRPWLRGPAALLRASTGECHGLDPAEIAEVASRARVLLNVSGMLPLVPPFDRIPVRAYLDLDPAFNQVWHDRYGIDMRFGGHTHHITVGSRLGQPGCPVPTCGIEWIATLPPVVLDLWPVARRTTVDAFTTVGNWRSYGSAEFGGRFYGQKAHSLRELLPLARQSIKPLAAALRIDSGEPEDLVALEREGWTLTDPSLVAGNPRSYRDFVQGSFAELGVAKSGYVASRCGWFSDRSAVYLASGRPVLAQDTGFGDALPVGDGLLAFSTADDAAVGIEAIVARYDAHRIGARAIAERHLDSGLVLGTLLRELDLR
jgi:hypothetical protein